LKNNYYIQNTASNFRKKNGIGPSEPIRLKSWLSKLGVTTIFKPLQEKFSGMALKHGQNRFMVINCNHSLGKQHFTAAHELYHLFEQDDFESEVSIDTGSFSKNDIIEYNADCFAAYLLLPEDGLIDLIPAEEQRKNKITIQTIVEIEQFFACSRAALLYRLITLDLIDFDYSNDFRKNIKLSAKMLGYDDSLYNPGNENLIIGDYGVKAKNLFDNEIISESHYIDLMNDIGFDVSNVESENE
jgi:Zn-dependent peptidase ImmA (M78 family)